MLEQKHDLARLILDIRKAEELAAKGELGPLKELIRQKHNRITLEAARRGDLETLKMILFEIKKDQENQKPGRPGEIPYNPINTGVAAVALEFGFTDIVNW